MARVLERVVSRVNQVVAGVVVETRRETAKFVNAPVGIPYAGDTSTLR